MTQMRHIHVRVSECLLELMYDKGNRVSNNNNTLCIYEASLEVHNSNVKRLHPSLLSMQVKLWVISSLTGS